MHGYLRGLRKLSLFGIQAKPARWMRFLLESDFHPSLEHLELSFAEDIPELALPSFPALRSLEIAFNTDLVVFLPPTLDSVLANIHTIAPLLECLSLVVKQWISDACPQQCKPCPPFGTLGFLFLAVISWRIKTIVGTSIAILIAILGFVSPVINVAVSNPSIYAQCRILSTSPTA
ncbi:hypothetical protein C8R44DRAFT_806658, partial [Mycena epipterygia]